MTTSIRRDLPLRHAVALGLLHGPTELLPVSSSGHTTLVPWIAGWPYTQLDPELRKAFEVALHAGTAAALLVHPPLAGRPWRFGAGATQPEPAARARALTQLGFLAGALFPPALTGWALGGQIERRLGTPVTIAGGLLAGSLAMSAAEVQARRLEAHARCARVYVPRGPLSRARGGHFVARPSPPPSDPGTRPAAATAGVCDGLALGLAQALALAPGVSRNGATLAAARARGFSRPDADRLSWRIGLPVIAGAALLKGTRLAREQGTLRELALPLAAGTASAFFSTLLSTVALGEKRRVRLLPACVVYRGALASHVIRRMRDNTT